MPPLLPPRLQKRQVWEVLNQAKPLWLRSPGDVSSEEYASFYKAISKVSTSFRRRCWCCRRRRRRRQQPCHLCCRQSREDACSQIPGLHRMQDYQEPLAWSHFKAEGDVEFRSILFIPKVMALQLLGSAAAAQRSSSCCAVRGCVCQVVRGQPACRAP
jgi:hypothetical protein